MPDPIDQHGLLQAFAGKWAIECRYRLDPGMPPLEAAGEESVDLLGSYWGVGSFTTHMMGVPLRGWSVIGYEPAHTRWVCTRVNSLSPYMYVATGSFDDAGRVLTMKGKGPNPQTGSMTSFRTRDELLGPDARRFEMFVELPDGGEQDLSVYTYRRV